MQPLIGLGRQGTTHPQLGHDLNSHGGGLLCVVYCLRGCLLRSAKPQIGCPPILRGSLSRIRMQQAHSNSQASPKHSSAPPRVIPSCHKGSPYPMVSPQFHYHVDPLVPLPPSPGSNRAGIVRARRLSLTS